MVNKELRPMVYIMSGYNQRAVIAFLRYLEKIKYRNYAIIAVDEKDLILNTAYKDHVIYIRKVKQLTINEFDDIFGNNNKEAIFMPSTEALVRFQIDYRDYFTEHKISIPVVEKNLYETVSDKRKFWELCKDFGFVVPRIYTDIQDISFPLMIKPKTYLLSTNEIVSPIKITSQKELDLFLTKYNRNDFDFQQFITGDSYYLLYYIEKNGEVHSFSQKNILQQPNGKSMIAAKPSRIHNEEICVDYGNMLKEIGFNGLIMIELRKSEDKYYMIEANPRMWGPSQLFVDAEVEFYGMLLNDNGANIRLENKTPDFSVRYYWSGGVLGDLEKYRISFDEDVDNNLETYRKYDIYDRIDTLEIFRYEKELANHG